MSGFFNIRWALHAFNMEHTTLDTSTHIPTSHIHTRNSQYWTLSNCSLTASSATRQSRSARPRPSALCSCASPTATTRSWRATSRPLSSCPNMSMRTSGSLSMVKSSYCPRLIIDLRSPNSHPNANPTFFLVLILVFDFYNYINMFYSSISDFCSVRDCPTMSAGEG